MCLLTEKQIYGKEFFYLADYKKMKELTGTPNERNKKLRGAIKSIGELSTRRSSSVKPNPTYYILAFGPLTIY